jgi:hypothetical protein
MMCDYYIRLAKSNEPATEKQKIDLKKIFANNLLLKPLEKPIFPNYFTIKNR